MPVISSPTRSRYSSYIMSRSASRMRCRMTCLAVCAAIRPKSSGVTSRSSIWSRYSANFAGSISGSSGSRISPVSGSTVVSSSIVSTIRCASRRSGMISSITRKSAVSRSISTRAYLAEPGCFLYADSSASSSAIISFSGSIPFSRASACMASRISRDMALLLDQVGSADLRVGDRDDAAVGGQGDLLLRGSHELPGEAPHGARLARATLALGGGTQPGGLGRARPIGDRPARTHASATADEAAEVRGLGQRALGPRRGDLQRVALAQVGQRQRHAFAQLERHAVGVVDEHTQRAATENLGEQHLDIGVAERQAPFDICLNWCHQLAPLRKKSGPAPTFGTAADVCWPIFDRRHESSPSSIASGRPRRASLPAEGALVPGRSGAVRITPRAIAIDAIVLALGTQRARQSQRLAGLAVAPQQLHRAAEAEQRVVVGRRVRGDRLELLRSALVVLRVKQRTAQRLADRGLVGLQVAGFAQRHDRRLVVAVLEQLTAPLVQVIEAFHSLSV